MEVTLLLVFMLHVHVSLAVWQRVTVINGQTLELSCPISTTNNSNVEWRNPQENTMFFNHHRALKDKRYRIDRLTDTEFAVSITNVTFKDGGIYTCSQYDHHVTERRVEVTVLSRPKMRVTEHEGRFVIRCTAVGNPHPPQISWKLDHTPETLAHTQVKHEHGKYVSKSKLTFQPVAFLRVTVKCLVRHPAVLSPPLMNFVQIGQDSKPQESTVGPITAPFFNSSEPETDTTHTRVPENLLTTTGSHVNTTGSIREQNQQIGCDRSSSLLIFLVTCLIVCLLVVVIFFAIKLRRAHIMWKKEKEESDTSEDSGKSKSSQEERNAKGQRKKAFIQYISENPTVKTSNTDTQTATESVNKKTLSNTSEKKLQCAIKETEL